MHITSKGLPSKYVRKVYKLTGKKTNNSIEKLMDQQLNRKFTKRETHTVHKITKRKLFLQVIVEMQIQNTGILVYSLQSNEHLKNITVAFVGNTMEQWTAYIVGLSVIGTTTWKSTSSTVSIKEN